MSKLTRCSLFASLLLVSQSIFSQDIKNTAKAYFENGNFHELISLMSNVDISNEKELQYFYGVSLYECNELNKAQNVLLPMASKSSSNPRVHYYLGLLNHAQLQSEKAVKHYKDFLRNSKSNDPLRASVINLIKQCAQARKIKYQTALAYVENIGPTINSKNDDFGAIQSPNFYNKYYFTSNREGSFGGRRSAEGLKDENYGKYYADMFVAQSEEGVWNQMDIIDPLLNSAKHDVIFDFSEDGSEMLFYKSSDNIKKEIYVNRFANDSELRLPIEFRSTIRGDLEDGYISLYNDSTFIYSSKRIDGSGGYDIYVTIQKKNEQWTEPINFGTNINSPYDEVSPFLTNDGTKLFFSSNRLESIGGFDVFVSDFDQSKGVWSTPKNLGTPINSAGDDLFYRINIDGKAATFSSDRKEGYGGLDLYIAYLKEQERHHVYSNARLPFLQDKIEELVNTAVVLPSGYVVEQEVPIDLEVEEPELKISEYFFKPMPFDDNDVIMTPNNLVQLNAIVDLLKIYPDIVVELQSHIAEEGSTIFELYYSIKRTEPVVSFLNDQGISNERIILKGYGNNAPKANELNLQGAVMARKLNRRIDLVFHNAEDLPLRIQYNEPEVAAVLKNEQYENMKFATQGLTYNIQLVDVTQLYQNPILEQYSQSIIERNLNQSSYQYLVGQYKSFHNADRELKKLKQDGKFSTAKIIPFLNGKRLVIEEVLRLSDSFTDLKKYIDGFASK